MIPNRGSSILRGPFPWKVSRIRRENPSEGLGLMNVSTRSSLPPKEGGTVIQRTLKGILEKHSKIGSLSSLDLDGCYRVSVCSTRPENAGVFLAGGLCMRVVLNVPRKGGLLSRETWEGLELAWRLLLWTGLLNFGRLGIMCLWTGCMPLSQIALLITQFCLLVLLVLLTW